MEFDCRRLHDFEPSRKHLAQAIVDGKGAAVLNDDTAKCGEQLSFFETEYFERHVPDEPFRHEPGEIGKVQFCHLLIEDLVSHSDAKKSIETAVEIGDGLNPLANTGRRQRQ